MRKPTNIKFNQLRFFLTVILNCGNYLGNEITYKTYIFFFHGECTSIKMPVPDFEGHITEAST